MDPVTAHQLKGATTMMTARTLTRQEATTMVPSSTVQKVGGIVALLLGLFYTTFLIVFLFVLPGLGFEVSMFRDPPRFVAFVNAHYGLYYWLGLVGVLLTPSIVVLVRALDERMRATAASPSLIGIATPFGYVGATILFLNWLFQYTAVMSFASAPPAFSAQVQASVTFDMTNLGYFLALGAWTLLLSLAAFRSAGLPRWLTYLGILVALSDLLVLFGLPFGALLTTIWFLAVGVVLLTKKAPEMALEGAR
jgi:Domain of unknown function (DUF4386)